MYKISIIDCDKVKQWHNTKYGRCIYSILKYICDNKCINIIVNINNLYPFSKRKEKLEINNSFFLPVFKCLFKYSNELLTEEPNILKNISEKITKKISSSLNNKQCKEFKTKLTQLFNYDAFRDGYFMSFDPNTHELFIEENPQNFYRIYDDLNSKNDKEKEDLKNWGGFVYFKYLDVTICPYCNAETIYSTIILKGKAPKKIKSELDHYYIKKQYPYLEMSLYNLVPSCTRCNRNIKGQAKNWNPNNYPHPYLENFHNGIHFTYSILKTVSAMQYIEENDLTLKLGKDISSRSQKSGLSNRSWNLATFMNLELIYNELFKTEIIPILNRIRFDIPSRRKFYRSKGIQDKYMDTFFWGIDIDPAKINKNRFAKIIIDLLKGYRLCGKNAIPI